MRVQELYAGLAIVAPKVVLSEEPVRVAPYCYRQPGGDPLHRKQLITEGTAVQHKSVASAAETGDKLVHDPTPRADVFMFRPLAEFHEFQARQSEPREARQGQGQRDFQRRRGTESSTNRNLTMNDKVGPGQLVARLLQGSRDAADEITPMPSRRTGELIEGQGHLFVVKTGVCSRSRSSRFPAATHV